MSGDTERIDLPPGPYLPPERGGNERLGWPAAFGASMVTGILSLIGITILTVLAVLIVAAGSWGDLTEVYDTTSQSIEQSQKGGEPLAYSDIEFDTGPLGDVAIRIAIAFGVVLVISWLAAAVWFSLLVRLFSQHRLGFGWGLVAALAGVVFGCFTGIIDVLLLGMSLGLFAGLGFVLGSGLIVRVGARPRSA